MKPHAKTALALALAIVGGIAAGMRCDASEWVDNSSQTNPRPAAYTVKTYTEGSDPFDAVGPSEWVGVDIYGFDLSNPIKTFDEAKDKINNELLSGFKELLLGGEKQ